MKNYKIILILLFITFSLYGQKMWKNDYNPRVDISNTEMKVEDAKQIILTKQSKGAYGYNEAVRFLYQFHRDSLSQFLLDNLNTPFSSKDYSKIYTDKYFRGLLGDTTAIQGMDSLAHYTYGTNKLLIIRKLTEVDRFNYYDFIIQGIQSANEEEKDIWYYTLSLYGANPLYKNEVSQILEQRIRAFVVNNEMDRTYWFSLIKNVSEFDKASAIRILEEYFFNSTGSEREEYYIELGLLDIEGQPERAKFALLNEQDDNFRKNYIPRPRYVWDGFYSKIFLDPSFIKFLNELELQPGSETYFIRKSFNNVYRPIKFDSSSSVEQNINSVINLIDTTFNYNWLGDLSFSNELKIILTTAKTNLQNGDSLACRVQVKTFQDLVDNVYKDSLNSDPRFVTIEGWKFLYWNAQYILDRLPEPPVIVNADIEVIYPAMSLVNPGAFTMEVKGAGFTSSSVVYFNGNARATTFFADTLLKADIQSTDVSAAGNYPVWVSSGITNSDTFYYSVVSSLPKPVRPVLECVRNNGDGTYTAYFGYKNENSVSVYIPVGSKNKFTPTPQDRGQTTVFQPGRKYKVFTVNFNGSNLVWTLNGRTSTASSKSALCN